MKHDELIERVRLMHHYMQTDTTATDPTGPVRQPVSTYTDPEQWEREKDLIFAQTPALVCLAATSETRGTTVPTMTSEFRCS